ncbi:MAG: hypothetical protein J6A15_08505 [Clostridia bacterium]|nr:hypothetical protein [Clostridia bacterium]
MLDSEIIKDILKKFHNSDLEWISIAVVFASIAFKTFLNYGVRKLTISVVIFLGILFIIYLVIKNRGKNVSKCNNKSNSVLLLIQTNSLQEYKETKNKFADLLRDKVEILDTKVRIQPFNDKSDYDKEKIIKMCKKANCLYALKVRVNSEELTPETKYIIYLDFSSHIDVINEFIKKVPYFVDYKKLNYTKQNKLEFLDITSSELAFLIQFVIMCNFIKNEKMEEASLIADSLQTEFNDIQCEKFLYLRTLIKISGYYLHMYVAAEEYENYLNDRKEEHLDKYKQEIENANKYLEGTYAYWCFGANYYFLKNRDVEKSELCLKEKVVYTNRKYKDHKFSLAFLNAYRNESEIKIVNMYIDAFRENKKEENYFESVNEVIFFIEQLTTEEEKKKGKLYLALAMLYMELGYEEKFYENINLYINTENPNKKLNPFTITSLEDRYRIDLSAYKE